ncbi:MAG: helix-turn-helix transcriptional regulator [Smithellaceae bacterium]
MALKHSLIGLLARFGPITGYSLHKKITSPRRPSLPQIYRSLREMAEDKLIEYNRVHAEKEPTKNLFSVTPAGMEELKRWLEAPDREEPIMEPLMPKLWFAGFTERDVIVKHLNSFAEYRKAEIKFYQEEKKRWISSKRANKNPADRVYWILAFDYIIAKGKGDLAWTQSTVKELLSIDVDTFKNIDGDSSEKNIDVKGTAKDSKRPKK